MMNWLKVQKRLKELGYEPGPLDGIRGRRTIRAVKDFQANKNIEVDGIVGPVTSGLLFGASGRPEDDDIARDGMPWYDEAERLKGTREVVGRGSNPTILDWADGLDIHYPDDDIPWCLEGSAEVLTDAGFVRLDEFLQTDVESVAQVNVETLQVEFVDEFGYVEKEYVGALLTHEKTGLSCDPDHELFGRFSGSGPYKKRKIGSLSSYGAAVPVIRAANVDNEDYSDSEIELLAAFLADGSLRNTNHIGFSFSNVRETEFMDRFHELRVRKESKTYGISKTQITKYVFDRSLLRQDAIDENKTLTWPFIKSLSNRQCLVFIQAFKEIEGITPLDCGGAFEVFSGNPAYRDQLVYIATMAGLNVTPYDVQQVNPVSRIESLATAYCSVKKHRHISLQHVSESDYTGKLYCLQVPSGVMVIRTTKGVIMPIGNCGLFVAHCIGTTLPDEPLPPNPLGARNWLKLGKEIDPQLGAVLVFWRGKRSGWKGHVGFYAGEDSRHYYVLGGNQSNKVSIAKISKSRLLEARWPETALPGEGDVVAMSGGGPVSTNEA